MVWYCVMGLGGGENRSATRVWLLTTAMMVIIVLVTSLWLMMPLSFSSRASVTDQHFSLFLCGYYGPYAVLTSFTASEILALSSPVPTRKVLAGVSLTVGLTGSVMMLVLGWSTGFSPSLRFSHAAVMGVLVALFSASHAVYVARVEAGRTLPDWLRPRKICKGRRLINLTPPVSAAQSPSHGSSPAPKNILEGTWELRDVSKNIGRDEDEEDDVYVPQLDLLQMLPEHIPGTGHTPSTIPRSKSAELGWGKWSSRLFSAPSRVGSAATHSSDVIPEDKGRCDVSTGQRARRCASDSEGSRRDDCGIQPCSQASLVDDSGVIAPLSSPDTLRRLSASSPAMSEEIADLPPLAPRRSPWRSYRNRDACPQTPSFQSRAPMSPALARARPFVPAALSGPRSWMLTVSVLCCLASICLYCQIFEYVFQNFAQTPTARVLMAAGFGTPITAVTDVLRRCADGLDQRSRGQTSMVPAVTFFSSMMRSLFFRFMFLSLKSWSEFVVLVCLSCSAFLAFPLRMTWGYIHLKHWLLVRVSKVFRGMRHPPEPDLDGSRLEVAFCFYLSACARMVAGLALPVLALIWRNLWNRPFFPFDKLSPAAFLEVMHYYAALFLAETLLSALFQVAIFKAFFRIDPALVGGRVATASWCRSVIVLVGLQTLFFVAFSKNTFQFLGGFS